MKRSVWAIALAIGCAGCLADTAMRNAPEGPVPYRVGFTDGCWSGRYDARGYGHRDLDRSRYRVDDLYRKGWNDGYEKCYRDETAKPPPALVQPPTPEPTPRPIAEGPATSAAEERQAIQRRIKELEEEISGLRTRLRQLPAEP